MFYAKTVELESGDSTESGKLKIVLPDRWQNFHNPKCKQY